MDFDPHTAVPVRENNGEAEARTQEDELLKEPIGQEFVQAASSLWDQVASLTSTVVEKSMEIAKVCQAELEQFASEVKVEAADIYSEHMASPLQQAREAIPTLIPNKVKDIIGGTFLANEKPEEIAMQGVANPEKFERSFLLDEEEEQEEWMRFKDEILANQSFSLIQQSTILANDPELNDLYNQCVPASISHELFWARWRLWRFKRAQKMNALEESEFDGAVNISLCDLTDQTAPANLQKSNPTGDVDWDSWE